MIQKDEEGKEDGTSHLFDSSPSFRLFHVIAVDPGRDKCGIALLRNDGRILSHTVARVAEVENIVAALAQQHPASVVIVGNRTGGKKISALLNQHLGQKIILVDEHRSTEEGRRRYFQENPPRGWRRLLPLGLQTPPEPFDDYVAVILAERYLATIRAV